MSLKKGKKRIRKEGREKERKKFKKEEEGREGGKREDPERGEEKERRGSRKGGRRGGERSRFSNPVFISFKGRMSHISNVQSASCNLEVNGLIKFLHFLATQISVAFEWHCL